MNQHERGPQSSLVLVHVWASSNRLISVLPGSTKGMQVLSDIWSACTLCQKAHEEQGSSWKGDQCDYIIEQCNNAPIKQSNMYICTSIEQCVYMYINSNIIESTIRCRRRHLPTSRARGALGTGRKVQASFSAFLDLRPDCTPVFGVLQLLTRETGLDHDPVQLTSQWGAVDRSPVWIVLNLSLFCPRLRLWASPRLKKSARWWQNAPLRPTT